MPKIYTDLTSLREDLQENPDKLPRGIIDSLVYTANLAENEDIRLAAQRAIREYAPKHGVQASSTQELYTAFGKGEVSGFTVPALNIRTLTYDFAKRIFEIVRKHEIGPVIFEIAVSEQEYTSQPPREYATSVLAAAMSVDHSGPVFLLGDHYQLKTDAFKSDREAELKRIENVIFDSIKAQFYNIDIDGSTLVDLKPENESIQQKDNYEVTAYFTKLIRKLQPENITIAIGGEIGHIGGVNSTIADFKAFMDGYNNTKSGDDAGLAKVSIQTGTSHGGIPKPDGTLEKVKLDADLHEEIGKIARQEYGIGGTVQHGASTLPEGLFHILPEKKTLEVHLATRWQNIVYDQMNEDRRNKMYKWIKANLTNERKEAWTDEQFIYKLRKKAFGHFKKDMWNMKDEEKVTILDALSEKVDYIFEKLSIFNTRKAVEQLYT